MTPSRTSRFHAGSGIAGLHDETSHADTQGLLAILGECTCEKFNVMHKVLSLIGFVSEVAASVQWPTQNNQKPGPEYMSLWIEDLRKPTTTKSELTAHLINVLGLTHREAREVVESFFDTVTTALKRGETVKLAQFGTFRSREKASRPGRNLRTSEQVQVPARRSISFVSSPLLKQRMQQFEQAKNPSPSFQDKPELPPSATPVESRKTRVMI